jgi:hypothetical protein
MKIINRTDYSTRALRWLITQTHRRVSKVEGRPAPLWRHLRVEVVYGRTGYGTGWATLGGARMRLRLRRPTVSDGAVITAHATTDAASLIQHEIYHTLGFNHHGARRLPAIPREDASGQGFSWAVLTIGQHLPVKQKHPRIRQDANSIRRRRYEHTLIQIKRWQTKLKRAQTALAKLQRRRRYYERLVVQAAGTSSQSGP